MQLGFVSAILPDLSLDEVLTFAACTGYRCVEIMCWPAGKAERRGSREKAFIECKGLHPENASIKLRSRWQQYVVMLPWNDY
jgi:sugar phosphate isomerase/epimerase